MLIPRTSKVYKNKKLNNANFGNFCHTDYQAFLYLVSKIGGTDQSGKYLQSEQLPREHTITAKGFSETFNASLSNCYGILKRVVDKLMRTNIRIEKSNDQGFCRINICATAEYSKKTGSIIIKFTEDIMPYLAQVRAKFILYNLKEISNFNSLYTTRLYELIQEFKETGWMLKSVEQLRETLVTGDRFRLYGDLKRYTFGHACQEINDNYDIGLKFEEIKTGRKVTAVRFIFKKTLVHKVINQRTGIATNVYRKPRTLLKEKISKVSSVDSNPILEGQLAFSDLRSEENSKPIKGVLSSMLNKFFPK